MPNRLIKHLTLLLTTTIALLIVLVVFFVALITAKSTEPIASNPPHTVVDSSLTRGKKIFEADCSSCHSITKTCNLLDGITDRIGYGYLALYITRGDSLLEAGDSYASALYETCNRVRGRHTHDYTPRQTNDIIRYIQYGNRSY